MSVGPIPKETSPLGRWLGLLQHLAGNRPVTVEEMKEAVKRRSAERYKSVASPARILSFSR